jgi:acyl-CoA thioester hydrolase
MMTASPSSEPRSVACGLAVVHPWLCDAMGHLTTRHYLAIFDDASYHLFAELGHDSAASLANGQGWADVSHHLQYLAELPAGAVVRIDGRVKAVGRSSIETQFAMVDRASGRTCATLTAWTVCFDTAARKSRSLPPEIVERARALFDLEA